MSSSNGAVRNSLATLRTLLLVVVGAGILGIGGDLILMRHWASIEAWPPLILLAVSLPLLFKMGFHPTRRSVRAFQAVMALFVVVGAIGVWLHWRRNVLVETSIDPTLHGWTFLWRTLFGRVPILAPGALVHMGLVGLLATFRHPATRERAGSPNELAVG
jgi:hypothetical protein